MFIHRQGEGSINGWWGVDFEFYSLTFFTAINLPWRNVF